MDPLQIYEASQRNGQDIYIDQKERGYRASDNNMGLVGQKTMGKGQLNLPAFEEPKFGCQMSHGPNLSSHSSKQYD